MIIFFAILVVTILVSVLSFLASHFIEKFEVSETAAIMLGSVGYIFLAASILICLLISTLVALVVLLQYTY